MRSLEVAAYSPIVFGQTGRAVPFLDWAPNVRDAITRKNRPMPILASFSSSTESRFIFDSSLSASISRAIRALSRTAKFSRKDIAMIVQWQLTSASDSAVEFEGCGNSEDGRRYI